MLAGQIGSGAAGIGRNVSARTGLPFAEVDRVIEHEAGCSLARIAVEEGVVRVEQRARAVLERLVSSTPFGLIVLESAWPPLSAKELLLQGTHFVHVQRPADFVLERLESRVRRTGDWILGRLRAPIRDEQELAPLFARRRALLCEAHVVLAAGRQHENAIAEILLDSIEQIAAAEAL